MENQALQASEGLAEQKTPPPPLQAQDVESVPEKAAFGPSGVPALPVEEGQNIAVRPT